MGEKAPIEDKSKTHGICDSCRAAVSGRRGAIMISTEEEVLNDPTL